ncbi:hypothetical protein DY000_02025136 [Brassica cretica]|uniref:Uncharacterized protein n=1 Tax=Brassica cretica TaxID=69181 RepID=A0ABQ7E6C6_BRACR|nr:hypothetical protein DY000_02025136 [Brassica cretica]
MVINDGGRRRLTGKFAGGDGGGAWPERACGDETSGGSSGFVRAPIEARSVDMASSRREEHNGGFVCTRFTTPLHESHLSPYELLPTLSSYPASLPLGDPISLLADTMHTNPCQGRLAAAAN